MDTSDDDITSVKFVPGHILWSKIGKHPYWPCMVTKDPIDGIYYQQKTDKSKVIYHVQYFGPKPQRGWTSPCNVFEFKGPEDLEMKLDQECKTVPNMNSSLQKKIKAIYSVPNSKLSVWQEAVEEAKEAFELMLDERLETFTFNYISSKRKLLSPDISKENQLPDQNENLSAEDYIVDLPSKVLRIENNNGICEVCHKGQDVYSCVGGCQQYFHLNCAKKAKGFIYKSLFYKCSSDFSNQECLNDKISEVVSMQDDLPIALNKKVNQDKELKLMQTFFVECDKCSLVSDTCKETPPKETVEPISEVNVPPKPNTLKKKKRNPKKIYDNICASCCDKGASVFCDGTCQQCFHLKCLFILTPPTDFKCKECTTGLHTCFICQKIDDYTFKCSFQGCGKFYHIQCSAQHNLFDTCNNICPLHFCLGCYNVIPSKATTKKGQMLKCFYCPTAYHNSHDCLAAGSQRLSSKYIKCPDHFEANEKKINLTCCFICFDKGNEARLVACSICPASFHENCVQLINVEKKLCDDCYERNHITFGMIIWAKFCHYRWWPAKVCKPDEIPLNLQQIRHGEKEFAIKFFGSHDYAWISRRQVLLYKDEKQFNLAQNSKFSLDKKFAKALSEAAEEFMNWFSQRDDEIALYDKPVPFKFIKTNKIVDKSKTSSNSYSPMPCTCNPYSENPCADETCLNRSLMFECSPPCQAGDKCQNQRLQNKEYVPTKYFKSFRYGWGLLTSVDVKKGQLISEYVGEVINSESLNRRLKNKFENGSSNYYFLHLHKDLYIDAEYCGNLSRFMNHSCEPNCETQKWIIDGDVRIGIYAIKDIPKDTELTFDYRLEYVEGVNQKCMCKSSNCSGALGQRLSNRLRIVEEQCFMCNEKGSLIVCPIKNCDKAYHKECLESKGEGNWQCPVHICNVCREPSEISCYLCPKASCLFHKRSNNLVKRKDKYVCKLHLQ